MHTNEVPQQAAIELLMRWVDLSAVLGGKERLELRELLTLDTCRLLNAQPLPQPEGMGREALPVPVSSTTKFSPEAKSDARRAALAQILACAHYGPEFTGAGSFGSPWLDVADVAVAALANSINGAARVASETAQLGASQLLPERVAAPPENSNSLREALAELVALKDLKERIACIDTSDISTAHKFSRLRNDYDRRKAVAWEAARKTLAGSLPPDGDGDTFVAMRGGVSTVCAPVKP